MFIAAAALSFVLLRLVALAIMALARRMPRPRRTAPRLALANIFRPGALTPSLVLSLGLGITLLVTLALIDTNLSRQLRQSLPERAPSFFFLDIPNAEADTFERFLTEQAPGAQIERVPMMRGPARGPAGRARRPDPGGARTPPGCSTAIAASPMRARCRTGSKLVDGAWWPADYRGSPLVSFDRRARGRPRPQGRRRDHRQRAGPQRHRPPSPTCARSNGAPSASTS